MVARSPAAAGRLAPDGSPYPDRRLPSFERDVRAMFTHIAGRYDWFDHVASLGNDYLWRPRALWDLDRFRSTAPVLRVLDVGCGTGDFSRLAARHYATARIVGADFTDAMLRRARDRTPPGRLQGRIELDRASALRLPYRDASFDVLLSAFVLRNLSKLETALAEFARVLASGGTAAILEITEPVSPRVRAMFHAYFDRVVPWLGAAVQSAGPYRYLPESLRFLPARPQLLDLLRASGFARVAAAPQSGGIVTTFLGSTARG